MHIGARPERRLGVPFSRYMSLGRRLLRTPIRIALQWNHGIGETVTALLRHGLRLQWLVEHDWTVLPRFSWLVATADDHWTPAGMARLPLTFSLLAYRPPRL